MSNISTTFRGYAKLLGNLPETVNTLKTKKEIFNYFLYYYEFTWSNPTFDKKNKLIDVFVKEITDKKERYCKEEITDLKKYWWFLTLVTINEVAINEELYYLIESIDNIFPKINDLDARELECYTNMFNFAIFTHIGEVLTVRPTCLKESNIEIYDNDFLLKELLDNKKRIIYLFSKNLKQKDFEKDSLYNLLKIDKKIKKPFATFWDNIFDAFLSFFLGSTYDFHETLHQKLVISKKNLSIEDYEIFQYDLEDIIITFFKAFLGDPELSENIGLSLSDIVLELMNEKYEINVLYSKK